MAYSKQKILPLAEAFMNASGFHGGGKKGTIGAAVLKGMNEQEQEEYAYDLPRTDIAIRRWTLDQGQHLSWRGTPGHVGT